MAQLPGLPGPYSTTYCVRCNVSDGNRTQALVFKLRAIFAFDYSKAIKGERDSLSTKKRACSRLIEAQ
jgi:hypothetical protein